MLLLENPAPPDDIISCAEDESGNTIECHTGAFLIMDIGNREREIPGIDDQFMIVSMEKKCRFFLIIIPGRHNLVVINVISHLQSFPHLQVNIARELQTGLVRQEEYQGWIVGTKRFKTLRMRRNL